MDIPNYQPNFNHHPKPSFKKKAVGWIFVFVLVMVVTSFGVYWIKSSAENTIEVKNNSGWHRLVGVFGSLFPDGGNAEHGVKIVDDPEYPMPPKDSNRWNLLVFGIEGESHPNAGPLLTDTILVASLDKTTGNVALASVPRDLTVRITDTVTDKINAAYLYNGLSGTERLYSRILGIHIDNTVVVDMDAFVSVVNTLGGIDVNLAVPFKESQQWAGKEGYAFSLPAGPNHLDGQNALYYVRSRYSSSDFDRSRRQMEVLLAIKQKAEVLNLTKDPIKVLQLVTSLSKHITTDLNLFDISSIKDLVSAQSQVNKVKQYHLTTENLLYETSRKSDGAYILLPRDNTLAHIKKFFQTELTAHPVLPTPIPANTSPRAPLLTSTPQVSPTH